MTAEGVLIGPAFIRTAASASRGAEITRELSEVEHELARTGSAARPARHRLGQAVAEIERLAARIERADAEITRAAEAMARLETEANALAREEESQGQRLAGVEDAAAAWRDRLAAAEPATHELPDLPRAPEPPIQQRVAVETLRRDRTGLAARLTSVRAEREALAAQDPQALAGALDAAGVERAAGRPTPGRLGSRTRVGVGSPGRGRPGRARGHRGRGRGQPGVAGGITAA